MHVSNNNDINSVGNELGLQLRTTKPNQPQPIRKQQELKKKEEGTIIMVFIANDGNGIDRTIKSKVKCIYNCKISCKILTVVFCILVELCKLLMCLQLLDQRIDA